MGLRTKMKRMIAFVLLVCMVITVLPLNSVKAASVKLNKTTLSMKAGDTYKLKLSGTTKVSWSSSNKKIATVSGKGVVSAIDDGTATITAKDKKTGKTYKCKVTVKNTMYLDKESVFIDEPGETATLKLVNSKATTYKSWNTKIATVDKNGKITGVAPGSCTVVAENNVTKKVYKCSVTVAVGKIVYNLFPKTGFCNNITSRSICLYVKTRYNLELDPLYGIEVYDKDFNKLETNVRNLFDENTIVRTFGNWLQVKYEDTYYLKISGKYWFEFESTLKNKMIDSCVLANEVDISSFSSFKNSLKHATLGENGIGEFGPYYYYRYDKNDKEQFSKIIPGITTKAQVFELVPVEITQMITFTFNRDDDLCIQYNYSDYNLIVEFYFDENNVLKYIDYCIKPY